MTDKGALPFTMTIIILIVVLLIFAMKYGAQFLRDRARTAEARDTELRLAALDEKSRDLDRRVAQMERMLREVE